MSKAVELIKQLQADSLVFFMKVHNFHWNVKGSDFYQVHHATEEIYEKFATMFDDLAELVVQLDHKPVVTLAQAIQTSKISEENKTSFNSREIFQAIIKDYQYFLEKFKELSKLADEINDKPIGNYADEQIGHFQKALWMLKATQV